MWRVGILRVLRAGFLASVPRRLCVLRRSIERRGRVMNSVYLVWSIRVSDTVTH